MTSKMKKVWGQVKRPFARGSSAKAQPVFGAPLGTAIRMNLQENHVPFVVVRICEYIRENGMDVEGIFRISGSFRLMKGLKEEFDQKGNADFSKAGDIMAVGGLLKLYLRELPEPLIQGGIYDSLIQIQKGVTLPINSERYAHDLSTVLHELEPEVFNTLKYICSFLYELTMHNEHNKMGISNLAIVFAPNIFACDPNQAVAIQNQSFLNGVMEGLIEYNSTIFTEFQEVTDCTNVSDHSNPLSPLSADSLGESDVMETSCNSSRSSGMVADTSEAASEKDNFGDTFGQSNFLSPSSSTQASPPITPRAKNLVNSMLHDSVENILFSNEDISSEKISTLRCLTQERPHPQKKTRRPSTAAVKPLGNNASSYLLDNPPKSLLENPSLSPRSILKDPASPNTVRKKVSLPNSESQNTIHYFPERIRATSLPEVPVSKMQPLIDELRNRNGSPDTRRKARAEEWESFFDIKEENNGGSADKEHFTSSSGSDVEVISASERGMVSDDPQKPTRKLEGIFAPHLTPRGSSEEVRVHIAPEAIEGHENFTLSPSPMLQSKHKAGHSSVDSKDIEYSEESQASDHKLDVSFQLNIESPRGSQKGKTTKIGSPHVHLTPEVNEKGDKYTLQKSPIRPRNEKGNEELESEDDTAHVHFVGNTLTANEKYTLQKSPIAPTKVFTDSNTLHVRIADAAVEGHEKNTARMSPLVSNDPHRYGHAASSDKDSKHHVSLNVATKEDKYTLQNSPLMSTRETRGDSNPLYKSPLLPSHQVKDFDPEFDVSSPVIDRPPATPPRVTLHSDKHNSSQESSPARMRRRESKTGVLDTVSAKSNSPKQEYEYDMMRQEAKALYVTIKQFQDDFAAKNGRKPEKDERATIAADIARYKELKMMLGKTPEPLFKKSNTWSPEKFSSELLTSSKLGSPSPKKSTKKSVVISEGGNEKDLRHLSDRVFSNLAKLRCDSQRPYSIEDMNEEHRKEEKTTLKKILKDFEDRFAIIFGRKPDVNDKSIVKEVYLRYKALKTLEGQQGSAATGSPSATLSDAFPGKKDKMNQDTETIQWGNEYEEVKAEKKKLQIKLHNFESEIMRKYGRKPTKEDKIPAVEQYQKYKQLKSRMETLEKFMSTDECASRRADEGNTVMTMTF
eukprot:Nk52_evm47s914 gene=Nk52_evmTU47s914